MSAAAEKHTIMTVDDTVENLNILEEMLTGAGYRVMPFPKGKLALQAALRHPPDLILLDVMMPQMDGFEACRRLRAHNTLADIPVIFISALGDAESKVRAFTEGGVDYVTKPFQEKEVLARIRTHLDLRRANRKLLDHKQHLEEMVRERTADLQQAQKVARLGSWKMEIPDNIITLSDQACRILGLNSTENDRGDTFRLDQWLALIHPDDLEQVKRSWSEALANHQDGFSMEYRVWSAGTLIWVHEDAKFEVDENGRPVRAIGTIQDVTERREYLDALERQNRTLRDIAWTQSHVVRAPLVRLLSLIAVLDDDGFVVMNRNDILTEITRSARELDDIVRDIARKTDNFFKPEPIP